MPDAVRSVPSLLDVLVLNPARDDEGRALLESAADQEALDEIRDSLAPCTYEDSPSRFEHEKPMNLGALDQAKRNFAGMCAVLRHLRNLHLSSVEGRGLVADDWRRICILGEMLPRFLFLRHHLLRGSAESEYYAYAVPAHVSTLFKTVRGMAKLLDYLRENPGVVAARLSKERAARLGVPRPKTTGKKSKGRSRKPGKPTPRPLVGEALRAYRAAAWTTDDLLWAAETFDLFVGDSEVCAAPTNMVKATLEALIDGKNPHDEIQLSDDLVELIGAGPELLGFCSVLDDVYRDVRQFRERCAGSVARMMAELRALGPGQSGRALAIHLEGLDRYLVPERHFLERCRRSQAALLAAAGCDETPPELGLDFVDAIVPQNRRRLAFDHFSVRVTHEDGSIDVSITSGGETATEHVPYAPE